MIIELTIYNRELDITPLYEKDDNRYEVTIHSPNLDLDVIDEPSSEQYEILIHQVMKGDPGKDGHSPYIDENRHLWEYDDESGEYVDTGIVVPEEHPYISLERLRKYLFRVTFDSLPEDNGEGLVALGGCSSYVQDGKLYTNLDWDYDNTASFVVRTRDFEGQSFIGGMNDGGLNDEQIALLPYRVHRGENNHGIKLASHILYNDWSWTGCGSRSINLTRLPFLVLARVKSMATLESDLNGVLDNLYCPEGLAALGYLLQIIVTDGTTTYALVPPTSEGESYEVMDITACPKMSNFRPVGRATVSRTDSDIQAHPTGIERYNMMPCELSDLRFTRAYETPTRLSEFIGLRGTDKDSTDEELLAIYNDARTEYLQRQRDGKTWQTMESAIYGERLESLWIQENWEDNIISNADAEIEIERQRALAAEAALGQDIQDESARAILAENNLAADIDTETQRATSVEGGLSDRIDAEEQRAKDREDEIEGKIPSKLSELENDADYVQDADYVHTDNNFTTPEKNKLAGLENYDDTAIKQRVTDIEDKIPSEASSANKLADKEFVNSSVTTNTAFFRGTWDLVEDLGLTKDATEEQITEALATVITEVTNNDYSFVFYNDPTTGIAEYYDRYKYSTEDGWGFEYRLNNSSFTAAQWATINSGLTSNDKAALDDALALIATFGDIVTHNASEFATPSDIKDGVLTIKQNGTSKGTFSANQSTAKTIELTDTVYDDTALAGRVSAIEDKESDWDAKLSDAPSDGKQYARKDGEWSEVEAGGGTVTDVQLDEESIVDEDGVANIQTEQPEEVDIDDVDEIEVAEVEEVDLPEIPDLPLSVVGGKLCITFNEE